VKILIAEDDLTARIVLIAMLQKWGFDPVVTEDGKAAWEVMQQPDAPKLLILDWSMPEMEGIEVCRRVRQMEVSEPSYIIILTSKGEKTDIVEGLGAGANDYVVKPYDNQELLARIKVGCRMIEMQDALMERRKELTVLATHDSLTGLMNHGAILDQLHKEIAHAGRHGGLLSVGMCDIDFFKQINDTYGHQTGDDVLRGFAHILRKSLRVYDSVGRIGGEEFLVITPMKARMDCIAIFGRLCRCVAGSNIEAGSGALSVTVSIGVSCAAAGKTVDEIVKAADAALYRAKKEGRNRVAYDEKCILEDEVL